MWKQGQFAIGFGEVKEKGLQTVCKAFYKESGRFTKGLNGVFCNLGAMSANSERQQYEALLKAVDDRFRLTYPSCQTPIQEWKGKEIVDFQEELLVKVQGRISEKWFYTHVRQQQDKLPRIDILNMLSQYAGFSDWAEFCFQLSPNPEAEKEKTAEVYHTAGKKVGSGSNLKWRWGIAAVLLAVLVVGSILAFTGKEIEYEVCFLDADTHALPAQGGVEILLHEERESPRRLAADKNACVKFVTQKEKVEFTVSAPYYISQTIVRTLNPEGGKEEILLKADDYALMLHYFSTSKVEDWKKRRAQLEEMLSDDVRIIQVASGSGLGVEMYNKAEFIDRMTLPVKSLRNMSVIETEYKGGKIAMLRFIVEDQP